MAVTKTELYWREWFLGEGNFKAYGRRNMAERHRIKELSGKEAPAKIPATWWQRLEEFLARRRENKEVVVPPVVLAPGQVSPHFNIREFNCKDGRKVPAASVPGVTLLARDFLEPLRARFGPCYVMSGYRHEAYNRAIGGARQSYHIYDLRPLQVAADLIFQKGTPQEWAVEARRIAAMLRYGGVGDYAPNASRAGFVHVDNRDYRSDWSG